MAGIFSVTVQEARGFVAIPSDLDRIAIVIGCSSAGSGLSPFFLSASSAIANRGYGDAVDTLCQIIEQRQSSGTSVKYPAAMYTVPGDTPGSYGDVDNSGVTGGGTAMAGAPEPYGTYEARLKWVRGGTISSDGGDVQWSLDGGRTYSTTRSLGTNTSFTIPNSNVELDLSGTFDAGSVVAVRTFGPQPATSDVDDAFTALAAASGDFALVVCEFPCDAAMAAHVTTGLNALLAVGKRVTALVRTRIPDFEGSESETTWLADVSADYADFNDSRIIPRAAYGLLTDATTTRQYLRSTLAQFAADVVRVEISDWPCAPNDQAEPNVILVDGSGATVGHDEGPRGAATGLSSDTLGNRFSCEMRIPDPQRREAVYNTVPWTLYAADERIRNLMVRRVANAMQRVSVSAAIGSLGGKIFYDPADPAVPGSQPMLRPQSRDAIHGVIYNALADVFAPHILNADDADGESGLVQVNPVITVSGGNLVSVTFTLAPLVFGYLLSLTEIFAVKQ